MKAHKCVRCGRCLSVCPYYRSLLREEYSPRGRIVIFEKTGESRPVYCYACKECKKICPFDLCPVELDPPPFKWKDRFLAEQNMMLSEYFRLIYEVEGGVDKFNPFLEKQ